MHQDKTRGTHDKTSVCDDRGWEQVDFTVKEDAKANDNQLPLKASLDLRIQGKLITNFRNTHQIMIFHLIPPPRWLRPTMRNLCLFVNVCRNKLCMFIYRTEVLLFLVVGGSVVRNNRDLADAGWGEAFSLENMPKYVCSQISGCYRIPSQLICEHWSLSSVAQRYSQVLLLRLVVALSNCVRSHFGHR